MTIGKPDQARDGHNWQKIQITEHINEENNVEWLEVCLHCHGDRHMLKRPDAQPTVLRTRPHPLPAHCTKE